MNPYLSQLTKIGSASSRKIVGLMSGTSLDGLDIALCEFRDSGIGTQVKLLNFKTISYSSELKSALKLISSKPSVDLEQITVLNAYLGNIYGEMVLACLAEWNVEAANVDLIASHGQTIYHAPKYQHGLEFYPNATFQIGDGDHVAVKTGIITLSDFRQKHIAAGGEGAPLSIYGDYLLFSSETEHRVLLNIGGISNFTYLPATGSELEVMSTDVGPGNTLMDQFVQREYPGVSYDDGGNIAASGEINESLLNLLLDDPFFKRSFPKTTGPEVFSLTYLDHIISEAGLVELGNADILATLSAFTVAGIELGLSACIPKNTDFSLYMSGGGMHNSFLLQQLEAKLGLSIKSTALLDVDPDAKEAVLFALLANECISGAAFDYPSTSGLLPVAMGKISLPR